jgi:ribonucleoside-diphosphate reductase alpha chain
MAKITDNALDLLRQRYFQEGENSWEDLCKRVSHNIASAEETKELQEKYQKEFYDAMVNMDFIPSTPTLLNAGTKTQQLSSCFILDIEDSIEGIMNTLSECAKIFQKSGGCGFNISPLRPAGSLLSNSGGFASGCVSFMRLFNQLVEEVKHGNSRKGAIKIDLDVSHPDIYDFIHCKDDLSQLQNMNISVSITDDFINAVLNDKKWDLKFNNKVYKTVKAKDLWDEIIESAWKTGEPGLSFRDVMNKGNMNPHLGEIKGSNPCSEFINIPYSSCNLGSINLSNVMENKQVNYKKLEYLIRLAVRFLDDMITINKLPLPKIQQVTEDIRPIGIGTMGLADMLFELEIPMNSQEGIKFKDDLYDYLKGIAIDESIKLAEEKGVYPKWEGSVWERQGIKIRNSNLISIAPNGSIGFIANVNGGIEPVFALIYTRRTQEGKEYIVVNKVFEEYLKENGLYSNELLQKIIENNGSCQGIKEIPKHIQEIFVTASDMNPMDHLKCLNAISKHVDLSVSKTINLPFTATKEDVSNIYIEAWKTGNIKGITVYRNNSRENQTLSITKKKANHDIVFNSITPLEKEIIGETYGTNVKEKVACGNLYLSLFRDSKGNICETFINTSKGGICQSNTNAISRLISLALRSGIKIETISDQLIGIKCPACSILRSQGKNVNMSCPDTIGKYLLEKYNQGSTIITEKVQRKKKQTKNEKMKCPNCGEQMRLEAGCVICSCGFSKCG